MAVLTKFTCQACRRAFAWKPELAGKKVRCKCGAAVMVPKPPDEPAHDPTDGPSLDDLYNIAGEAEEKVRQAPIEAGVRCPGCTAETAPGAMLCTNCGMDFKTGKRLMTSMTSDAPVAAKRAFPGRANAVPVAGRGGSRPLGYANRSPQAAEAVADDTRAKLMMLIGPGVCFFVGLAMTYAVFIGRYKYSLAGASVAVAINLAISMVLIAAGCLIAMRMLNFSLGAPQEAALKVAAVAVLPAAISDMVAWYFGTAGGFIGWGIAFVTYFIMLMKFFDLDGMEVNILAAIIWLLQTFVGYALVAILLSAIMGGNSMLSSGAFGVLTGVMGSANKQSMLMDSSPAGRMNRRGSHYKMEANSHEALKWLKGSSSRNIIDMNNADSIAAVQALYDAGSPEVYVAEVHTYGANDVADKVVVDLPSDPAKRARIVAVHKPAFEKRNVGPADHDPRQEYMVLDYDGNDEF